MKPRKTRIKVVTRNVDGLVSKHYTPQHRGLLGGWYDFTDFDAYNCFAHTNAYYYATRGSSLTSAQEQIDSYIKAYIKEDNRRKGKELVSVEYIKYP